MMEHLILYPIVNQFALAVILTFFTGKPDVQRVFSIVGSAINVVVGILLLSKVYSEGMIVMQAGNWAAPFGITLAADTLAATLVLLTSISAAGVSLFAARTIHFKRVKYGFFAVFHFMIAGLNGAFLTGDIFNLYVWFEIIIICSFVLITLGGRKGQLEGAIKYFTLNSLASVIFLTAIAVLYGLTGTLNMADLAEKVPQLQNRGLVQVSALLFFIGFGVKSAVFPMYFWLPASYHTPPSAVSSIFGGLMTKLGVYAIIRVFTLIYDADVFVENVVVAVAVLTIFAGGAGALVSRDVRKIFGYMIICHIGFMIGGVGLMTKTAIAGSVLYLIHDIIVKTNLFMVSGLIKKVTGNTDLNKLGGLYSTHPLLVLLMSIPLFSLVGIPPLSGFWPKVWLIGAGFEVNWWFAGAVILGSFLTLFVIAKLWMRAFWGKPAEKNLATGLILFDDLTVKSKWLFVLPIILLSIVSLYIGFGAEITGTLADKIATELLDKSHYVDAVLTK